MFLYLFKRIIFRIKYFFRQYYITSFYFFSHFLVSFLEKLDRFFAFKITLKHFFTPLYQDYSLIGYLFGFIFRSLRILIGAIFYLLIIVIFLIFYFLWLIFPIFVIFKVIESFLIYIGYPL